MPAAWSGCCLIMTYSPATVRPAGMAAQPAARADVTTAAGCGAFISPAVICLNKRLGASGDELDGLESWDRNSRETQRCQHDGLESCDSPPSVLIGGIIFLPL